MKDANRRRMWNRLSAQTVTGERDLRAMPDDGHATLGRGSIRPRVRTCRTLVSYLPDVRRTPLRACFDADTARDLARRSHRAEAAIGEGPLLAFSDEVIDRLVNFVRATGEIARCDPASGAGEHG